MKEKFADETSLNLLSKYDILKNQTFILHLVVNFECFLANEVIFGGDWRTVWASKCVISGS